MFFSEYLPKFLKVREQGFINVCKMSSVMIIVITGTPGTGKTTLAKALATRLDIEYISDKHIIDKYDLAEGFDNERNAAIIDEERFAQALEQETRDKNAVIDSHLSHFIDPAKVDLCIVTTCELGTLKKRLQLRDYSDQKIRENLDAQIFETCFFEAQELGHNVLEINTESQIDLLVEEILEEIKKQETTKNCDI
ncbi:AAA family ATPase [Candidatus Woesearchaeota archaeon]|nr:MAG: AAA family ATPase [Candidatus Woesearchaeota archaeon]